MMNSSMVISDQSTLLKEKQKAHDYRPINHRATSCDADCTSKARSVRYDHPSKLRQPAQTDTSSSSDMRNLVEKFASHAVTGQEDETLGEDEPLPPPEVTSASVMAMVRLEGSMSDLKEAIAMYEDFDQICRDTPAWRYFAAQQVSNIRYSVNAMRRLANYISYLRENGQGTIEWTELERLAKDVFTTEKEARKEWKGTVSKFKDEEEDPGMREEHQKAFHQYLHEIYGKKIKNSLGQLETAASEIDTLKQQLKTDWTSLSKATEKELDEIEKKY